MDSSVGRCIPEFRSLQTFVGEVKSNLSAALFLPGPVRGLLVVEAGQVTSNLTFALIPR